MENLYATMLNTFSKESEIHSKKRPHFGFKRAVFFTLNFHPVYFPNTRFNTNAMPSSLFVEVTSLPVV